MTDKTLPTEPAGPTIDAIPEPPEQIHRQAQRFADRIGLGHPPFGRLERLIVPGLHKLLDRIEALEKTSTDDHK